MASRPVGLYKKVRPRVLQILMHYKGEWIVEELIRELCEDAQGSHWRHELHRLAKQGAAHYRTRQVPGQEKRYRLWKLRQQK